MAKNVYLLTESKSSEMSQGLIIKQKIANSFTKKVIANTGLDASLGIEQHLKILQLVRLLELLENRPMKLIKKGYLFF